MPQVSLPIISQLVHPSLGLLSRVAAAGNPQAGPFIAVAPPQNPLVALTYGAVLKIHSVGAFHGRDVAFPVQYDPPLGKLSVHYNDLTGFDIIQQVELWTYDAQPYLWEEALPALFVIQTSPDVVLDLFWLQT